MSDKAVPFRRATRDDVDAIVRMARAYYAEDGYPFDDAGARRSLLAITTNESLGWLWVAEQEGVILGYLAVTLGFSLEYRGRDAFVDELYVVPSARGRGLGKTAIDLAVRTCRSARVRALHLEVERNKSEAIGLYRSRGFQDHDRFLMTKLLAPSDDSFDALERGT